MDLIVSQELYQKDEFGQSLKDDVFLIFKSDNKRVRPGRRKTKYETNDNHREYKDLYGSSKRGGPEKDDKGENPTVDRE